VAVLVKYDLADLLDHPLVHLGAAIIAVGYAIARSPTLTDEEYAATYGGDLPTTEDTEDA